MLQTFLVFRYLSVVRFLSRSGNSFLAREDKDNAWQDEEARERLCGVLFRPTIPFTQVLSTTKRLGNACGDAVGVLQSREKEKSAYCFGQQYEMKVVRTLARDLPWNFHVCLVLPLILKPSNRPSPLEYNVHKNSLVLRRPARFSFRTGVRFSQSFIC